jgi:hypothetical protein
VRTRHAWAEQSLSFFQTQAGVFVDYVAFDVFGCALPATARHAAWFDHDAGIEQHG